MALGISISAEKHLEVLDASTSPKVLAVSKLDAELVVLTRFSTTRYFSSDWKSVGKSSKNNSFTDDQRAVNPAALLLFEPNV